MKSFFLTVQCSIDSSNTRTPLPYRINLNDEWYVGLVSFSYPNVIYNFKALPNMCNIFCNLVEHQCVGSEMLPLLRSIVLKRDHHQMVTHDYKTPHYIHLLIKEFDSLEIYIKDENFKSLLFGFNRVIVKLHFIKSS